MCLGCNHWKNINLLQLKDWSNCHNSLGYHQYYQVFHILEGFGFLNGQQSSCFPRIKAQLLKQTF